MPIFRIMSVFVALAVAELLRAGIVAVAKMTGHWDRPAFTDVGAGFADGDRGGVRFGGRQAR